MINRDWDGAGGGQEEKKEEGRAANVYSGRKIMLLCQHHRHELIMPGSSSLQ